MNVTRLTLAPEGRTIPVEYADGGVEWAASRIAEICAGRPQLLLVSDERVALHYQEPFLASLDAQGFRCSRFIFPPGERGKRLSVVSAIVDVLAEGEFARDDVIVGFGGGVVTDVAGFAAAIYKRGTSWIAVPTSLLGMADAALGGKTGVDHALGKNLIGAFHQPTAVLAPCDVLETLDDREWRSGSVEVVKCALLSGGEAWARLQKLGANMRSWPRDEVRAGIANAAATKLVIVAEDARDYGKRRLLNLGHTFGHALEAATEYGVFSHGEAVCLGMRAAARLSNSAGLLAKKDAQQIDKLLAAVPFPRADVNAEVLLAAIGQDKKVSAGQVNWILIEGIGKPRIVSDAPPMAVRQAAEWLCGTVARVEEAAPSAPPCRVLVISGPNLNLLGTREPDVYGAQDHDELVTLLQAHAAAKGVDALVRQSNSEGEIVELIQRARHWADAIIINPGGYSHTSVAIRDALSSISIPALEVHLSDVTAREDFRLRSLTGEVCAKVISGAGAAGYLAALDEAAALAQSRGAHHDGTTRHS